MPDELPIVLLPDEGVPDGVPGAVEPRPDSGGPPAASRGAKRRRRWAHGPQGAVPGAPSPPRGGFLGIAAPPGATLALLGLGALTLRAGLLEGFYPLPGKLAAGHAAVAALEPRRDRCARCHHRDGLTAGCLLCHEEIRGQLQSGRGLHPFLLQGQGADCTRCHREHLGEEHAVAGASSWPGRDPERFRHEHVTFRLEGRHGSLACRECHEEKLRARFALSRFPALARRQTSLGLEQACAFCHEDIHSGGLSADCESCHDQERFRPASKFDHGEHFALAGAHEHAPCAGCHPLPRVAAGAAPPALPFARVRGTRCVHCHDSPHRVDLAPDCEACHLQAAPEWAAAREQMAPGDHDATGFPLDPPHDTVPCERCHPAGLSYEARFPDPQAPGYRREPATCQGCHEDVHRGQFAAAHASCLDCHERLRFQPPLFDRRRHEGLFVLSGAHATTGCDGCHEKDPATAARRFAGTPRECAACHEDPHAGQFAAAHESCADCHDTRGFTPSFFARERHQEVFVLEGAHRAVPCGSCHPPARESQAPRYAGTPRECKGCHEDPHGGQFAQELGEGDCTACHRGDSRSFAIRLFDHSERAGYALTGAHARAACGECHRERPLARAGQTPGAIRQYRGTSTRCAACHRDEHRGQFARPEAVRCDECHRSTESWSDIVFDHDLQSRFPLDGTHAALRCDQCHRRATLSDGDEIVHFKPLGTECRDCHQVVPLSTRAVSGARPRS